jgi:hypothetical protein
MAATPSAQPRLWRRSHRPVATTARGSTVLTAEWPSTVPHLGATPGLQACLPTGDGGGDQPQTPRIRAGAPAWPSRSRSSLEGKIDWATLGGDGDERRRSLRIPLVGWKCLTRQSECPTWRRQSSPEVARIERRGRQ